MQKTKLQLLAFILALVLMAGMLVSCGETNAPAPTETSTRPGVRTDGKPNKVALILQGPISDMSWNTTAYNGLKKIEALGAEIGYTENTPLTSAADAIETFIENDYNIVFLSSNELQDIATEAAVKYPHVQFFLINATYTADNARSFAISDVEQGFLMGALASLISKTGTVAFIGGMPINPIIKARTGFEQGARYVNPEINIIAQDTGSMDDTNAAKELARAMVAQGADVLCPVADQSSLGVMEAAEETGVLAIASGENQNSVAPNAAVVAIVKDTSIAYEAAYKSFLDGKMSAEVLPMGVREGVIYISDYFLGVDEQVKTQINDIYEKIAAGEITFDLD